jgi:hypothetical protein
MSDTTGPHRVLSDEFERLLIERADAFEAARVQRAADLDAERRRRARRTNRQFWFLFVLLTFAFMLLAYRTEANSTALENGFYDACIARQDRQIQANVGRETMVQLAANGPNAPTDPVQKTLLIQQLRDALLLPVEDCGQDPRT